MNKYLDEWIKSEVDYLLPDQVVWVNGSDEESKIFNNELVKAGTFIELNKQLYPNCFLSRSHPSDVARVESQTYISTKNPDDAGPLNNWRDPEELKSTLKKLMSGCMRGRTMYVIPYLMGPLGSPFTKVGFELTDSLYVVQNMRIMARIGDVAMKQLANDAQDFVKGTHSVGTFDAQNRFIAHFPDENRVISFNSGYGGNALQAKKCFALRLASCIAKQEGWLAEHMLILGIKNPKGKKKYFAAAFPSACGKTNLAMLIPPKSYQEAGWEITTVGDDIAWLRVGEDRRLWAINPENGFFGVAPGTSLKTNPNAIATTRANTIFTNVALNLADQTPWWEKMTAHPPQLAIDWLGNEWSPDLGTQAAHPNSRFTAPARQCPSIDPAWEDPNGVPISAIIFGGRRSKLAPLVYQTFSWEEGVFAGASMASERTAAAEGKIGELARDPMAMRPFIGYNVGDYLSHWLSFGLRSDLQLPQIFHVNWFRTGERGEFIWPGFGENIRVLEWIFNRLENQMTGKKSEIGFLPDINEINFEGLKLTEEIQNELFKIDHNAWREELEGIIKYFQSLGSRLPEKLMEIALRKKQSFS
ncbi:MAG TPA: phosphoenolpyruvate carboxykinase (GTP) [Oligoflexia bacterium]|nr:phosphoenolpyruvate carboxykinase (GTP) [Oligoflexia bacterium]HMP26828.1 phosphoenolpyruvate carboxykinase (GTP) [Oligoflexia bacterium]